MATERKKPAFYGLHAYATTLDDAIFDYGKRTPAVKDQFTIIKLVMDGYVKQTLFCGLEYIL